MSPELREIVEKAYRLFSDYRPGPSIHCIYDSRKLGAEVEAALLTLPLREIPRDLLAQFNDDACAYGPRDPWWPYFLPRYFELVAGYEYPTRLGAESALQCLAHSGYRKDLPNQQVAVIDRFGIEFFTQFICQPVRCIDPDLLQICYSNHEDVYNVLRMLVSARIPLPELLGCWDRLTGPDPDLHLADLVNGVYRHTAYGANPHFTLFVEDAGAILADWLAAPQVRRRLEMAFFNTSDERKQAMLSLAEGHVTRVATLRLSREARTSFA